MWEGIEARVDENDRDQVVPFRQEALAAIKASALRPGSDARKMVALECSTGERLVWQVENSARYLYLHHRLREQLEAAGFKCKPFPYDHAKKDGGRHSNLSRDWSFGDRDCVQIRLDDASDVHRLVAMLEPKGAPPQLDASAAMRWIARLRELFPSLDRFDRPDPDFDARERDYKIETADLLRARLAEATSDGEVVNAVVAALTNSNLLQWRAYWPMSPKGNGDPQRLGPALRILASAAEASAEGHPQALADFAEAWADGVPDPQRDHARQIGEFMLMHLAPATGIYIRHAVREDFWREGFGTRFPRNDDLAETYRNELRFMQAVRDAFANTASRPAT